MKTKNLLKTAFLLLALMGGATSAWGVETTITLSGATTKGSTSDVMGPSGIASSSATITTGATGSSCATTGYHLTTKDGKTCTLGGTTYYLMHTYDGNNSKASWYNAGLTNQYGTFTVPAGYTFKITKVTHAMACQSATFSASIIVKDAASNAKYTSSSINVPSVADKGAASTTDIVLAAGDQVTLNAGTYTLNVNISSTNTGTGKYAGIAQVVLTGDLATAGIDTASPEITTDLDDESAYSAYLGVEKTLSIEADHVTGYQWYTCTNAAGDGASEIDGATNYVYAFTPSVAGTYYYKCVATNTNATGEQTATSKVATVNVQAQTPVFSLTNTSIIVGRTSQIIVGSKAGLDGLTLTDLAYDDEIISISASGAITALAIGTTTITFTTAASGNYAAGSANLSITVTGKVVASSTPNSWTDATSRTWSVTKIAFGGQGEEGDNGLYFKTGTSNSIDYSSGDFFSLKSGNIMYLEVPSSTSTGLVKVVSTQSNNRYLVVTNSEGDQQLKMSTGGNTVRFDENSIEEIGGKYYVKLSHGDGECKIAVSNFATVTLDIPVTISAYGKSTFSSTSPVDCAHLPSGLKAYKATACDGSTVTMEEVTTAVAGMTGSNKTGLVLVGTPNTTYKIPAATSGTEPSGNLLFGWDSEWGNIKAANSGTNFVLSVQSGNVVWAPVKSTDAPITTGQAALWADVEISSLEARGIRMVFPGDVITGVANVEVSEAAQKEGKFIENGKLVIYKNGKKFNAAGQIVK